MSATRILCTKSTRVAREWEQYGQLLYGHRTVSDNLSWQASLPTEQEKQDDKALARGVCPTCFCVLPAAGACCD